MRRAASALPTRRAYTAHASPHLAPILAACFETQRQFRRQRLTHAPIGRPGIGVLDLREAPIDRRKRPLRATRRRFQFVPADRHGHAHAWPRPHAIGKRRARTARIAQIVDENLLLAVLGAHGSRDLRGPDRGQMLRNRTSERLGVVPASLRRERHDDMQPLAAARFAERFEPEFRKQGARGLRRLDHAVPAQRRIGVQVEHDPIGPLDVVDTGIPGVQLDDVHLRRAHQRSRRIDREQRRMARVEPFVLGEFG
ncbi:hypothetical protein C7410_14211 [Paraburkholderia silvatlantica]|uniref:Uncharacterized protein n=1 Tax=Paraburkholderia silvatlantica TaxID=321895 RepID=A0A2V4UBU9_9BURK|nr:hypothetical protein C7410_14211 [Paraburkholderia silvatlantica]